MMDIEKLIEQLRKSADFEDYPIVASFAAIIEKKYLRDAATALSTLQAENKRLNKIVCTIPTTPDSGRTVSQYDKEMSMCAYLDDLEAENEKLRETVDKYATAARVIALHLKPFCDESLPYDEMIADAARKASDELERVTAERDAAVSDIENALAYGLKDCELCVNVQCYVRGGTKPCLPKWRGPKKED